MKTNKEIYKAAFRPVHTSDDFWTEVQAMKEKKQHTHRSVARTAALVACVLALCAVTAFAAVRLLSPAEVAGEIGNSPMQQAFLSESAVTIGQTQTFPAHSVTLMGLVSGTGISDLKLGERADELQGAHTYCVLAVERTDGQPLGADGESFLFSPWIDGRAPDQMQQLRNGGWELYDENNQTAYFILDTAALVPDAEASAVRIGVQDGGFFGEAANGATAFLYDTETGVYSRSPSYPGVNALFDLTPYLP